MKHMNLFKELNKTAGFTLVELLVVIGILGVMAAALLAAIDPFEQLKKAQDSNLKNIASEFVNANTRYYATHNALPWFAAANGGGACYAAGTSFTSIALTAGGPLANCEAALITDGELKSAFTSAPNLVSLTVSNPNPQVVGSTPGTSPDTIVCFQPQSKSVQKDLNTKYTAAGALGATCIANGGATKCFWCAQ